MGKLELLEMKFFAHHGCFSEEKRIGNFFIVDFEAETDMDIPSQTDDLDDAVNYQIIFDITKEEMAVSSNLLEHVAGRILRHVKREFPSLGRCSVSISKLNPPLGGEVRCSKVTLSL